MGTDIYTLNKSNVKRIAELVADVLLKGGVCIIPTDTIYGIVALEDKKEAVERIYEIKKRPADKRLIRLIGSTDSIERYTDQKIPEVLRRYWPGPLTIIFKKRDGDTIALRYPDDEFLKEIFLRIGDRSIVAPSANISGEGEILECSEIIERFNGLVDIIVCKNKLSTVKASTIVDISEDGKWRVIREGDLVINL